MATPMDALYFREQFGRQLRRPERGNAQAFIVAPFLEGQTRDEQRQLLTRVRRSLVRCVDYGEVHYVSAEMTAMLQELVNRYLQDRTIFHFDQGDIPSLTGFVYFDGHIQLPTIYSPTGFQDLRAILWDQYAIRQDEPQVYFGGAEEDKPVEVIGKLVYTVCDTPSERQRADYGPWKMRHWIPAQYGVRFGADMIDYARNHAPIGFHDQLNPDDEARDKVDATVAMLTVLRTLIAWTRVIQTEIPTRHASTRDYDKVMHKEGRPPADVKVTLLRRYSDTPPHGLAEVDWAYRWEVKGHYRWQRVGPGRSLMQRVWVKKHVKGPPDKPLVVRDSITALVR